MTENPHADPIVCYNAFFNGILTETADFCEYLTATTEDPDADPRRHAMLCRELVPYYRQLRENKAELEHLPEAHDKLEQSFRDFVEKTWWRLMNLLYAYRKGELASRMPRWLPYDPTKDDLAIRTMRDVHAWLVADGITSYRDAEQETPERGQTQKEAGAEQDTPDEVIAQLERDTPPLDTGNGQWVKNKLAAQLEGVEVDTLATYRKTGIATADKMIGRDKDGRVWQKRGTKQSHPYYLSSSLLSSKKTRDGNAAKPRMKATKTPES